MPTINPIDDCRYKIKNVQTAAQSVIFDEFQNLYLLENYLECLIESQKALEVLIDTKKENA
jgi:hypothetical protein